MSEVNAAFLESLKENLRRADAEPSANESIALAVSGGRDSMVLLHACCALKLNCLVLHVNYGLRGQESDADASFVKHWCADNGVECLIYDAKTEIQEGNESNIQQAARTIRYRWFDEVCKDRGIRHLLLAHHRSDQVETFFLQLFRGSGANGLSGMKLRNGIFVRPLLDAEPNTIQGYAEENQLNWREDSSNKKSDYTRNFLRNDILPLVRQRVPHLDQVLSETCTRLQSEQNLMRAFIERLEILSKDADGQLIVDLKKISDFPEKERILHQVLSETAIPFAICRAICENLTSTEERVFYYNGFTATLKSGKITVYQTNSSENIGLKRNAPQIQHEVVPLNTDCIDLTEENVILLPYQINPNDLHLRTWRKGDYFYPSGMLGKKKISDFWNDLKLDKNAKNAQWLLCCNDDIVWVVNRRKDRRFEIKPEDKSALKVSLMFDDC